MKRIKSSHSISAADRLVLDNGRIYAETLAQETGETITLLDPLTTAAEGNPSYIERMRRNIQAVAQHWKEAAA